MNKTEKISINLNITNLNELKNILNANLLEILNKQPPIFRSFSGGKETVKSIKKICNKNAQSVSQYSSVSPKEKTRLNNQAHNSFIKKAKKKYNTFFIKNVTEMQNDVSFNNIPCDISFNSNFYKFDSLGRDNTTNINGNINTDISGNKISKQYIPNCIENDPFIYINEKSIPEDICNKIISRFEDDDRKGHGVTSSGLNKDVKNTMDLPFTHLEDWKDIDNGLSKILTIELENYCMHNSLLLEKLYNITSMNVIAMLQNVVDFGYQIQVYKKNEGHYAWHNDLVGNNQKNRAQHRLLTFIWYLNDVDTGGETEFLHGLIKPKAGKLIVFPASFTYFHKGNIPISNDKYIVTGWVGWKILAYA
jgi:hypothetical protein